MDIYTCRVLKPTKLRNGGWVRIMWCKASQWTYSRGLYRAYGRDEINLRAWRLSIEYKREPE